MARKISWNSISDAIETGILSAAVLDTDQKMTFAVSDVPESMIQPLLINGLKQKLADSAAGDDNPAESYATVWANLLAGKWSDRGEGGSGPKLGLLLDAFIRFRAEAGKPFASPTEARESLVAKRDAFEAQNGKGSFRKAMLANTAFAAIYAAVEKERDEKAPVATAVESEALLD